MGEKEETEEKGEREETGEKEETEETDETEEREDKEETEGKDERDKDSVSTAVEHEDDRLDTEEKDTASEDYEEGLKSKSVSSEDAERANSQLDQTTEDEERTEEETSPALSGSDKDIFSKPVYTRDTDTIVTDTSLSGSDSKLNVIAFLEEDDMGLDREALIQQYQEALTERAKLQSVNLDLQQKLAVHFRKKKTNEAVDSEKNQYEQEQRYIKFMAQLSDLEEEKQRELENYMSQIAETRMCSDNRQQQVDFDRFEFFELKKEVALNSAYTRSGRPIAYSDVEAYMQAEGKKDADVTNTRLESIKLKYKLLKKEQLLKSKEELGKGLHLIDFEQLKVENQSLNEKIEERNEELRKLRRKISSTVQILTHLKEKLQCVQGENRIHAEKLQQIERVVSHKRDVLTRTKQTRDVLRISNHQLRQKSGLLGNTTLLRDFEERQTEADDLKTRLGHLQIQHSELTLTCRKVRKKIDRVQACQTKMPNRRFSFR